MAKEAIIRNDIACCRVEYVAGADIAAGEVVPLGTLGIGIAINAIANTATGALSRRGLATFPAASADTWAVGTQLYWDNSGNKVYTTATSSAPIGIAHVAKTAGQTSHDVLYG